jgi:hypothetical protein
MSSAGEVAEAVEAAATQCGLIVTTGRPSGPPVPSGISSAVAEQMTMPCKPSPMVETPCSCR